MDGLIIGLGISCFVLIARWLFADAPIFGQIVLIFIGAIVLGGMQMVLERFRAARINQKKAIDHTADDATLLHSPRMAWDTDPQPISEQIPPLPPLPPRVVLAPTATEHRTVTEAHSSSSADPHSSPQEPILPEPAAEHSQEKMV
jgi:type IV secretory pathway VirB10-like protein